jgi:hypothetical protein
MPTCTSTSQWARSRSAPPPPPSAPVSEDPFRARERLQSLLNAVQNVTIRPNGWASRSATLMPGDSQYWQMGDARLSSVSIGSFAPSAGCPTPRLWVILTGHFRSFLATQNHFRRMAEESVGGQCYMFVAFLPKQADDRLNNNCFVGSQEHRHNVEPLMRRAQSDTFGGRLSFATAEAWSLKSVGPNAPVHVRLTPTQWCGAYLLTLLTAERLGLPLSSSSVVLLTRPDKAYTRGFRLEGLQQLFRSGSRAARHLMLGQEDAGGYHQGDHHLVTSLGCFHSDIGLPLTMPQPHPDDACVLHVAPIRQGFGQSMLGLGRANNLSRCASSCGPACRCLNGKSSCEWPSCYPIVAESFRSSRVDIVRDFTLPKPFTPGKAHDLAASVHGYCPIDGATPSCSHQILRNAFWIPQDAFYRCDHGVPLRSMLLHGGSWPCPVAADEACVTVQQSRSEADPRATTIHASEALAHLRQRNRPR